MQSTAFNSVVSPRGVKPRSTQSIPARVPQPRGGLTSLKNKAFSPKLASKVVGVVPAAEDLIGGLQMAGGGGVSYADYMRNGAAPGGLDAGQYQDDYQRYQRELERAQRPARGLGYEASPERAAQREQNTSNLPLALGAGALGAGSMMTMTTVPGDIYEMLRGEGSTHPAVPTSEKMREWPSMLGVDTKSPTYQDSFDIGGIGAGALMLPQLIRLARKIPGGLRTLRDVLKDETAGATSMPEPQGHGGWR